RVSHYLSQYPFHLVLLFF
ncbi:phosphate transporter permease subunit PstC, partial [Haemophilus influenzae]